MDIMDVHKFLWHECQDEIVKKYLNICFDKAVQSNHKCDPGPQNQGWGIFVAISKNTLYGSKLLIFLLWQKSLEH